MSSCAFISFLLTTRPLSNYTLAFNVDDIKKKKRRKVEEET
jgi:hypothetical protein